MWQMRSAEPRQNTGRSKSGGLQVQMVRPPAEHDVNSPIVHFRGPSRNKFGPCWVVGSDGTGTGTADDECRNGTDARILGRSAAQ